MARSLTVKHTETPGTSRLLNGFLALAFGWLVLSMIFAGATASPVDGPVFPAEIPVFPAEINGK